MTPIDDDDLRAMLEARAGRVAVDPVAVITEGRRRAVASSATRPSARRVVPSLAAFGAVVAIVLVVVTPSMPTSVRPTGSATVSDDATPIITPSAVPSAIEGAVTAVDLGRLLGERTMVGQVVFLDGELVPAPGACTVSPWCGQSILGLTTPHSVLPADALAASSLLAYQTEDLYALRVGSTSAAGVVGLAALGRVDADGDAVLWPIETLAAGLPGPPRQRQAVEELFEVSGWIVRTPLHSCPSTFGSSCTPTDDFLTSESYQPVRPDGSTSGPPAEASINLVSGSYDAWAPEPTRLASGVEPRRVTLLVRWVETCGSPRDAVIVCRRPARDLWMVADRLDSAP